MAKAIHKEFETISPKGREFIKLWNKSWRDGAQIKLAKHFKMSVPTVYRIRKKLNLPDLFETPARKSWEKRVCSYYHKGYSTLKIAEMYKMCSQNINKVLKEHNVEMKPQHVVNCTWYSTRQLNMSHHQLLIKMKELYCDNKMTVVKTAKELGIDPGTVTNKLRAMDIDIRLNNHKPVKGGYQCHWCSNIMDRVWQNSGPRKQKYCDSKCSNKAKDLRRMAKQTNPSNRLNTMLSELKDNWGDEFPLAHKRLFDVKPAVLPKVYDQDKLNAKADEWMNKFNNI